MTISGTNISMIRGDSETITVNFTPSISSGDTITLTVRETPTSVIAMQKSVTAEDTVNQLIITIDHADTANLSFGRYVYDLQLTRADGTITTIIPVSRFVLKEEVTY